MKAGPTDRFLRSISTCPWYFDTPALPTTADVNRSFQVGVPQALSERARGIDNVLREHFETHTLVEWMTEVNLRQGRADKAVAERDQLQAEVEQLRRPLMVVEVDADLSEEDVTRFRAKWQEVMAADPRPVWAAGSKTVRLIEWTLGDEFAPYDSGRVYNEADARVLVKDPDSTSVLWVRETCAWRKAGGDADGRA